MWQQASLSSQCWVTCLLPMEGLLKACCLKVRTPHPPHAQAFILVIMLLSFIWRCIFFPPSFRVCTGLHCLSRCHDYTSCFPSVVLLVLSNACSYWPAISVWIDRSAHVNYHYYFSCVCVCVCATKVIFIFPLFSPPVVRGDHHQPVWFISWNPREQTPFCFSGNMYSSVPPWSSVCDAGTEERILPLSLCQTPSPGFNICVCVCYPGRNILGRSDWQFFCWLDIVYIGFIGSHWLLLHIW